MLAGQGAAREDSESPLLWITGLGGAGAKLANASCQTLALVSAMGGKLSLRAIPLALRK